MSRDLDRACMTLDELRAARERIDERIALEEIRTAPWPWPRSTEYITPSIWTAALLRQFQRNIALAGRGQE